MNSKSTNSRRNSRARPINEMTAKQARAFFLKPESYCRLDLPPYFDFGLLLRPVAKHLATNPLVSTKAKQRTCEGVNHTIYSNKDGRYAWRPFQLVHPAIYVDLVNLITEPNAWAQIQSRFAEFAKDPRIRCLSLPQESPMKRKDQGAQVRHWWQGIEQASVELALDFTFVLHADITDCYASIYTHTIAWAMHEKLTAKHKRNDKQLVGNQIDKRIQDMRQGQTNGIPQGSVLLDLIAELVLGYADLVLARKLTEEQTTDFQILRYRDDYRIFVKDSQLGESILRKLTEVLIGLGLKLNASKTTTSHAIIGGSLKVDKRTWMQRRHGDRNLQKHMLLIYYHGTEFPNSGSLWVALDGFYRRLLRLKAVRDSIQLISIAIDIGYNNPRCFPVCAAIVSKLVNTLPSESVRKATVERIRRKVAQVPNNGHLEVWLQRITYPIDPALDYQEKLCALVKGEKPELWNSSWISDAKLKRTVDLCNVIKKRRLNALEPVVLPEEFSLFFTY